jgi:hypothetical protein
MRPRTLIYPALMCSLALAASQSDSRSVSAITASDTPVVSWTLSMAA